MGIVVPASRQALIASGHRPAHLDRDRKAGRSVAVFRGVHVDAGHAAGLLQRVRAALATQATDAVAGMQTSAWLHRLRWLPLSWSPLDADIHVVVSPGDCHRQRCGIRLYRRELDDSDRDVVDGIPCLSLTRTLVELARLRLPDLLVVQILDGALHDRRTTKDALLGCVARFAGERNIAVARRRIDRSRDKVRSPQETRLRLMLEDAGISVDVAIQLCDWDGHLLAEGDLGIKKLLLWGEYDGFETHTSRNQFRNDRVGDRWLDRRGWKVMRFVDTDLQRRDTTIAEWRQAIADAPARIAGLDARRSPEIAEAQRQLFGRDHGIQGGATP